MFSGSSKLNVKTGLYDPEVTHNEYWSLSDSFQAVQFELMDLYCKCLSDTINNQFRFGLSLILKETIRHLPPRKDTWQVFWQPRASLHWVGWYSNTGRRVSNFEWTSKFKWNSNSSQFCPMCDHNNSTSLVQKMKYFPIPQNWLILHICTELSSETLGSLDAINGWISF